MTHKRLYGFIDATVNDPGFERIATEPVLTLGTAVTTWQRR
ncbi:MAG TPA: hypothetical protein VK148_11310 [Xanthobacteraceae bacterium]|nr:hypothetical protein [Xanthobacteraceae bacterium]